MTTPEMQAMSLPRALAVNLFELTCPGVHELTRLPRPESREARIEVQRAVGQTLYVTKDFAYAAGSLDVPGASVVSVGCDFDRQLHLFDLRERLGWHASHRGFD